MVRVGETTTFTLIERTRADDQRAWSRLVERHDGIVRRAVRPARHGMGTSCRTDVEDLSQEAWRRIIDGGVLGRFVDRTRGAFGRLLSTISRGVLVDALRHDGTVSRAEEQRRRLEASYAPSIERAQTPSCGAQHAEYLEICQRVLGRERFHLWWRIDVAGEEQKAVARDLRIRFATLRTRLHESRALLKSELARRKHGVRAGP